MCNFWFCDFWSYLSGYNKILRIDEDCLYYSDYNLVFEMLDDKVSVYGKWSGEKDYVTKGLQKFTNDFMSQHLMASFILKGKPSGPYTNVIGFNLQKMRKNVLLMNYITAIKESDNIYIYRWGDLPLWGEALLFCFPSNSYQKTKKIKYFHSSHNSTVN